MIIFFVLDFDLFRFFNKLKATPARFLCTIVLKSISNKSHVGLLI